MNARRPALLLTFIVGGIGAGAAEGPVAQWKLDGDARNAIAGAPDGAVRGVVFGPGRGGARAAVFDGRGGHIVVPAADALRLGRGDFTVTLWINPAATGDDDLGELVSQFDPRTRTGFHLSLRNHSGVTHSQANHRQLHFALDAGTEPVFVDEGRPGTAIFGQSMAVHDGDLFVGTCEPGADQAGRVYRYAGPGRWEDCGAPDRANSVTAMAAWNGALYVGSGKYRLGGSSLKESENPHHGGRIFRYRGGQRWEQVGHFPGMEATGGMVVYRGKLYVSSLYRPATFHRYEGEGRWTALPVPHGKRVEALGVFDGHLWATGYDEGHVYRFDGERWTDLGQVGEKENTQTYAFTAYQGRLHVATWRTGKVYAWEDEAWRDRGRLGAELEVMGMLVHNGALYGGTLPLGQIHRYEGGQQWKLLRQLDATPDVTYRRVWTMASYRGKLYATTLPSGRVWSLQTGAAVTWDREFPSGWRHVAAQRQGDTLRVFVDGRLVVAASEGRASTLNLDSASEWRLGAGSGDYLHGALADVRVYRRALSAAEVAALAR